MKYLAIALATVAIGLTGPAFAGPAKDASTTAKAPKLMTDAQLASVVAGGTFSNPEFSGSYDIQSGPTGPGQPTACVTIDSGPNSSGGAIDLSGTYGNGSC